MAAVYQHILCARSFTGLTFRPNYVVPRHVHLHFGGGEKDPQRDKCLRYDYAAQWQWQG